MTTLETTATAAPADRTGGPDMKSQAIPHRRAVTAATGQHAPVSGWRRPNEEPCFFRYLHQGAITPPLEGNPILWTLVHELPPSQWIRQPSKRQ
jgi:hypothetical protein